MVTLFFVKKGIILMRWRTLFVTNNCKLSLSNNLLTCRKGDHIQQIPISDLQTVILDSQQGFISFALLAELSRQRITLIGTNESHLPSFHLTNIRNYTVNNAFNQVNWKPDVKKRIWSLIIQHKLRNQAHCLLSLANSQFHPQIQEKYHQCLTSIKPGDPSNIEGQFAAYYWKTLFGVDFNRRISDSINAGLNYGYAVLLAHTAKIIRATNHLTFLGVHHSSVRNDLNLACDLMEPFRPMIDQLVFSTNFESFEVNQRIKLVELFDQPVLVNSQNQRLINAIRSYVNLCLAALNDKKSLIELEKWVISF